jgi:hypothetical protein
MAQGAIQSPIDANVQERKVAILRLHGKLNIPVKAIQMKYPRRAQISSTSWRKPEIKVTFFTFAYIS